MTGWSSIREVPQEHSCWCSMRLPVCTSYTTQTSSWWEDGWSPGRSPASSGLGHQSAPIWCVDCWHTPPTEPALILGKQMIWAIRGLLHKRTGQTVALLLLKPSPALPGGASLHPGIPFTTLALCWEPLQTIWPLLWAADTTSCYH